eukprot:c30073_g1_i1 orf=35-343(+)
MSLKWLPLSDVHIILYLKFLFFNHTASYAILQWCRRMIAMFKLQTMHWLKKVFLLHSVTKTCSFGPFLPLHAVLMRLLFSFKITIFFFSSLLLSHSFLPFLI